MNAAEAIRRLAELRQLQRDGTPAPASCAALVAILQPTPKDRK